MKKLVFGVIATVMFSASALAGNKVETKNAESNKVYSSSQVIILPNSNEACKGGFTIRAHKNKKKMTDFNIKN